MSITHGAFILGLSVGSNCLHEERDSITDIYDKFIMQNVIFLVVWLLMYHYRG